MRWKASLVLAAVLLAMLAPGSAQMIVTHGHLMIGSLDVCHSATPALSSQLPCLIVPEFAVLPDISATSTKIVRPVFKGLLFPRQTEQPPEA